MALHYSQCPVVWPALGGLPALLTLPASPALRSKQEKAAGDHRPQTWCQGFDALASVQRDSSVRLTKLLTLLQKFPHCKFFFFFFNFFFFFAMASLHPNKVPVPFLHNQ